MVDKLRRWEQVLEGYYKKYNYNFVVQKIKDFPYPWFNYRTKQYYDFINKEGYVSQREVFYDEVVFDIDMDKDMDDEISKEESVCIAKTLSTRLKDAGFAHSVWDSGGSGTHIHIFIPELLELNNIQNRIMKRAFIKTLAQGFIRPRQHSGKVQLQHLTTIQLEESLHRKGKKKKLLWQHETEEPNTLSQLFYDELKSEEERNDLMRKYFKQKKSDDKPAGITLLESENFYNFKDGRDRALFILTGYYKQFLDAEETYQKMKEWNTAVLKGYFSDRDIKAKVKSSKGVLAFNYLVELLDELGVSEKYIYGDK